MNYYNEWDKNAAAWLRELIKQGHIPPGIVDERSITEVKPDDLKGYTQVHFFAGIGGWSRALRLAGVPDDFPCWTGSPPCQPFSVAGKQLGQLDERHLAPTFMRLVDECRPPILFGEQVAAAIGKHWLDDLFTELERQGYSCGAAVLPACSVGAPHKRDRLFFGAANQLAYATSPRYLRSESAKDQERRKSKSEYPGELSSRSCRCAVSNIQSSAGMVSVANNLRTEWNGERVHGLEESDSSQRGGEAAEFTGCSDTDELAYADSERSQGERADSNTQGWEGSDVRQVRLCSGAGYDAANPDNSFWSGADWLGCRDGKFRPVRPSTFPLANGIPARVGRLRGYGNAIVPQVASEFIRSFFEAVSECQEKN